MLASLLNDPETMQKLAGIASQLMGGAADDAPPAQEQQEQQQSPEQTELPAAGGDDPTADFMLRALPAISAIAQGRRRPVCPERGRLLDALPHLPRLQGLQHERRQGRCRSARTREP